MTDCLGAARTDRGGFGVALRERCAGRSWWWLREECRSQPAENLTDQPTLGLQNGLQSLGLQNHTKKALRNSLLRKAL